MRKDIFILLCFLMGFFQSSPTMAQIEVIFSPEGVIKENLFKEMESTTSSLDLAIHDITSHKLAQTLLKAKGRGVKVRIIADSTQAKKKSSQITLMIHQGILIKVLGGKEQGAMNHRFAILDGKKVITGSFDWSGAYEKRDYENILILQDSEVVASYQKEFDWLWRLKRVIR
jgi:phosphatidylserine/phosphatidylglycerophosphate/cardiolipin synthase-like enzyme